MTEPFASPSTPPPVLPPPLSGAPVESAPRRRRGCMFFLIGLAVAAVVLGVLAVGAVLVWLGSLAAGEKVVVSRGSVLELTLDNVLAEAPPAVDWSELFGGHTPSMWELRRTLALASEDPKIVALRIHLPGAALGWASAEELVTWIDAFRASGKPVHALLETDMVSDLDYFLATAADTIWVTPQAGSAINGLVAEAQFLRGTLEKLHIKPEVLMYKEYKSAGEQFGSYQMSAYMREALLAVLDAMADRFADRVHERRGTEPGILAELMHAGIGTAVQLEQAGLVDHLGYLDQVEDALVEAAGLDRYTAVSSERYARSQPVTPALGDRIAVVFGEGPIVAQRVESTLPFFPQQILSGPIVAAHLRAAANDDKVKAIVFRVNSPGGSAVGSDLVRREVERARAAGKPVIASMGDVAGSGGYWVAMGADAIVARSTTITGSIGVVFSKFDLTGFYQWLGIGVDQVHTAPNADLFGTGAWEAEDRTAVEGWMDQTYGDFTRKVAEGRGLGLDHVLEVARGRIWSGRDALERRLIDRVGGLDDAIALARERAELSSRVPLQVYPPPKSWLQGLMDRGTAAPGRGLPASRAALAAWLEEFARPQVQALMPDIRVR